MTTLFFIEHANGQVSDQSLKAISATSQIDGDVHGLIVGSDIDSVVAEASKIEGLSKLMHVDDDSFNNILAENLTQLILNVSGDYEYFLAAATTTGKNVMPRLAAKLDVSQISEIIAIEGPDTLSLIHISEPTRLLSIG